MITMVTQSSDVRSCATSAAQLVMKLLAAASLVGNNMQPRDTPLIHRYLEQLELVNIGHTTGQAAPALQGWCLRFFRYVCMSLGGSARPTETA